MNRITLDELPPVVWSQQVALFSQTGTPDCIQHLRSGEADILLFYDDVGRLRGILKHFEKDVWRNDGAKDYPVAHAGEVFVILAPDYRRRGFGMKLLQEATRRWNIDLGNQAYTPSGAALVERFERDLGEKESG
jgi:GNAT superfamily N-acetyltransferase